MNTKFLTVAFALALTCFSCPAVVSAQTKAPDKGPAPAARPNRPTPPARDPHTPGYVEAKELPDGELPPADADGNFIIGPTHKPAREAAVMEGVPQGAVHNLTMNSADSKIYPGIAREPG